MFKFASAAQVSLVALSLGLAACGGGGGGPGSTPPPPPTGGGGGNPTPSPTPTPTPTPAPPPTTLDGLDQSATFEGLGRTGAGTYPLSGAAPTYALRNSDARLEFNADDNSWTISVDGRTRVFRASDYDADQSSGDIITFTRVEGGTTDYLSLTRKGQNGDFTYRYVGSAFWQRTVETTSQVNGTFDAMVFGIPTEDNALPTGGAFYDISVIGAIALSDSLSSYFGQGEMVVDFLSGQLWFDAAISGPATGDGFIQGNARLTGAMNEFLGTLSVNIYDRWVGPVSGQFFGPNAEEVGASFQGRSATDGTVTVGTIMGSNAGSGGGNQNFGNLTRGQFFDGEARSISFDANGRSGPASNIALEEGDFRVGYTTRQAGLYIFFRPDGSAVRFSADDFGLDSSSYLGMRLSDYDGGWLQYAFSDYIKVGRFVEKTGDRYTLSEFIFGFDTDAAALPTGSAAYRLNLGGTALLAGQTPFAIYGQGALTVDFATGMLSGGGAVRNWTTGNTIGTWDGSAQITSGSSDFAGDWGMTGENGAPDFAGGWSGGFFGPAAEEVGATFSATASNGSALTGVVYGDRDDALLAAGTPLADITEETIFDYSSTAYRENVDTGEYYNGRGWKRVVYDPASGTYSLIKHEGEHEFGPDITFTGADRVDAESDDSYIVYRNADGEMRLLNFDSVNPVIDLTYVTFAQVTQAREKWNGTPLTDRHWTVFGTTTPIDLMPRSGSASYSGIVRGAGYVQDFSANADIEGTFNLAVNFGAFRTSGDFAFTAIDPGGGLADLDLGSVNFEGNIFNAQFDGAYPEWDQRFFMGGWFFGPKAEEVGGNWEFRRDNGADRPGLDLIGIFVGKKD